MKLTKEQFFTLFRQNKAKISMPINMAHGMILFTAKDDSARLAIDAYDIPDDIHNMILEELNEMIEKENKKSPL